MGGGSTSQVFQEIGATDASEILLSGGNTLFYVVLETNLDTVKPISFFIYSNLEDANFDMFTHVDQFNVGYSNGLITIRVINANSEEYIPLEYDVYMGNAPTLDDTYIKEIRFFKVL